MENFTVNLQLTQKRTDSFNDEFNLNDQKKWDLLRTEASKCLSELELADFPENAPKNPDLWFRLYQYFPHSLYSSQDEDLGWDLPHRILTLSNDEDEIRKFSDI
jgi:hypothetical protein